MLRPRFLLSLLLSVFLVGSAASCVESALDVDTRKAPGVQAAHGRLALARAVADGASDPLALGSDQRAEEILPIDPRAIFAAIDRKAEPASQAVPMVLHRVLSPNDDEGRWLGADAWQAYADHFDVPLKEWSIDAVAEATASTAVKAALAALAAEGRRDVAADLAGLAILQHAGGVLLGPDLWPPQRAGAYVSFVDLVAATGVSVAVQRTKTGRNASTWQLTNVLLAASPEHPWLTGVTGLAADNCLHLLLAKHADWPRRYFAGSVFLGQNAIVPLQIIPTDLLATLSMFTPTKAEQAGGH